MRLGLSGPISVEAAAPSRTMDTLNGKVGLTREQEWPAPSTASVPYGIYGS